MLVLMPPQLGGCARRSAWVKALGWASAPFFFSAGEAPSASTPQGAMACVRRPT